MAAITEIYLTCRICEAVNPGSDGSNFRNRYNGCACRWHCRRTSGHRLVEKACFLVAGYYCRPAVTASF